MKAQKAILTALLTLGLFATLNAQPAASGIREEAVSFTRGDATYSGTLSLPANEGVYPLVIMVSAMGNQDREWSFMRGKYKMAKIISDYLNQNGIAVSAATTVALANRQERLKP
ncbi:MAG TPA: hypothetical protein VMV56_02920 [Williamwhitmania sp.]|nr:hypothetical protein [Williamwhitmania sp.]